MKKLFALILIVALAICAACAEDWQAKFADYSLEELQAMAAAADAEIVRRTGESFIVPQGVYIIGEDIPAGTYRLEYVKRYASITVYPSERMMKQDEYSFTYLEGVSEDEPTIGKIKLVAGEAVEINSNIRFTVYKGFGW